MLIDDEAPFHATQGREHYILAPSPTMDAAKSSTMYFFPHPDLDGCTTRASLAADLLKRDANAGRHHVPEPSFTGVALLVREQHQRFSSSCRCAIIMTTQREKRGKRAEESGEGGRVVCNICHSGQRVIEINYRRVEGK